VRASVGGLEDVLVKLDSDLGKVLLPVDLGEEVYDLSQEKNAWPAGIQEDELATPCLASPRHA
jgi:hypothetical protein